MLVEAEGLLRDALQTAPAADPDRPWLLANLAEVLRDDAGSREDHARVLDEVRVHRQAAEEIAADDLDQAATWRSWPS
jgi:hypothetical protein